MKPTPLVALVIAALAGAPATRREPVTDEYHGVKVTDDYRWLEDAGSPEVKDLGRGTERATRASLDAMPGPDRGSRSPDSAAGPDGSQLHDLAWSAATCLRAQDGAAEAAALPRRAALRRRSGSERVVVDPNALDAKGTPGHRLVRAVARRKLVAVSLSEGGSEDGDVARLRGRDRQDSWRDVVPRVQRRHGRRQRRLERATAPGFYYTRYPHGGERPAEDLNFYQQVYFHKLGTPTEKDTYVIGKDFPRIAEIDLETSRRRPLPARHGRERRRRRVRALPPRAGRHVDAAHALRRRRRCTATLRPRRSLYLLSRKDAPRGKRARRSPLASRTSPKADGARARGRGRHRAPSSATKSTSYVTRPRRRARRSCASSTCRRPPAASARSCRCPPCRICIGLARRRRARSATRATLSPPAWYRLARRRRSPRRPRSAELRAGRLRRRRGGARDARPRRTARKVPVNILRRRRARKLDGSNPDAALRLRRLRHQPSARRSRRCAACWLEQGGVFAIANLRGGGEFGEDWHQAGNLTQQAERLRRLRRRARST